MKTKEDKKTQQFAQECADTLKKYTGHKYVKIVHRGNAAIFAALAIAKKVNPKSFLLMPDQGGWISYQTYPKLLGFDIKTVNTNRGLIDLVDLENKAETGAAFIVSSFAGYFAEQSMKYIHNICKEKGCLLIEDASGAIGDDILCDGKRADIIVGSFNNWKVVDVGYGGFISTNDDTLFDAGKEVAFSITNHYPEYTLLLEKLKNAPEKIKKMIALAETVKKELLELNPTFKIIHSDLRGLNVVVRYMDENEKEQLIAYCDTKKYDYVECPKYIRLEEDAISIELKRLDFDGKKK